MKKSTFLILLSCLFLFTKCKKEIDPIIIIEPTPPPYNELCKQSLVTTHEFRNIVPDATNYDNKIKVTITFPDCYKITGLTGLDDRYGNFIVSEYDILLSFGIGQPAGTHGLDASSTKTVEVINGRELWYEEKYDKIFFSFPSAGPASFETASIEYKEEILSYLRTLTVRAQ